MLLTSRSYSVENQNLDEVNVFDSLSKSEDLPTDPVSETAHTVESSTPSETKSESKTVESEPINLSTLEEQDDLQSLKDDIGEVVLDKNKSSDKVVKKEETKTEEPKIETKDEKIKIPEVESKSEAISSTDLNYNVQDDNDEKKILLELAKKVKGKIDQRDWDNIIKKAKVERYEIKPGENLKTVSKMFFGTEQYYTKLWSLNPQITNPNEIEPGTIISFDSGDTENMPNVSLGEFSDDEITSNKKKGLNYSSGDDANQPGWIKERKKLIDQGVYFQFASEETYEDLERLERDKKNNEWEKYDPPISQISINEPGNEYDTSGFDKNAKIVFSYKEGFFLNTFVTTNVIQDLGEVYAAKNEAIFIHKYDTLYVKFDRTAKVKPGDNFTIYSMGGEVKHPISDRSGFLYTTTGQIRTVRKIDDVWECYLFDQSGVIQRKDRITVFTPKIGKIAKTFGKRSVEAAIIGAYKESLSGISFGDVVYLDRGRADGVELGNIFEIYSFVDKGTDKKITPSPTYRIGELTVINITDNFATALVTNSKSDIGLGNIALMKTQEEAAKAAQLKNKEKLKDVKSIENKALDELDVELNLDDVSQDILNKADKVQLTEDEIEELDRQERDKSIIKNQDRDVKELDRLESEILDSEKSLNESKVDEDKFLEQQSLDDHERKSKLPDPNAFESINEIEKDIGRKYLDEDINNKENPFGLTEFDLEEIDELLNTGSKNK
jgi:hypothetical protein